jgi:hypothetical protein
VYFLVGFSFKTGFKKLHEKDFNHFIDSEMFIEAMVEWLRG